MLYMDIRYYLDFKIIYDRLPIMFRQIICIGETFVNNDHLNLHLDNL